uniref:Alpha-carbonic anhydrase domain-containing protein n=1 Tax=Knipowitschia caucasica TaxID=637954 RepID=A0AAV2KDL3_KNICA
MIHPASPIDIVSKKAIFDSSLTPFTFTKFKTALTKIEHRQYSGVGVSGGGLSEPYSSLSFHLHWGNGASVPGSEHTVDGRRYPMESSYNGNITAALADSEGIAEHGFFIEASNDTTGKPESWKTLTSYLSKITEKGQSVAISDEISLDDLLPNVNRKRFYRYLGSLEIPNCHEAVVWTVFKEPVKVCKDLIDLFSKTVRIGNSTSAYITNNHRITQPELPVTYS